MEGGRTLNTHFLDYKMPNAMDMPPSEAAHIDTYEPEGPMGAKEAGPILRESVADALQVRMRIFQVMLLVDESDDVIEDENAFYRIAHHLLLRFQPVDDDSGTEVDKLVRAFGVFHQINRG